MGRDDLVIAYVIVQPGLGENNNYFLDIVKTGRVV